MIRQVKNILLVNFGGPRNLDEIPAFLTSLLTDQEVVRTGMPPWLHRRIFSRVAKKRSKIVSQDYASIGGKSPIFEDTENLAGALEEALNLPVTTFHRYLPATHEAFIEKVKALEGPFLVLPLFPQFSYATTGSIALWMAEHLPSEIVHQMRWVISYPEDEGYIAAMQQRLSSFCEEKELREEETAFLFSAHGLPKRFICTGDPYESDCEKSFQSLIKAFPSGVHKLSYQSLFGKGQWLVPYTSELVENPDTWTEGRKQVVIVPLSFVSDHVETLFEIEQQYLPPLREKGIEAYRCPALNLMPEWVKSLAEIARSAPAYTTQMLIRQTRFSARCEGCTCQTS